MYYDQKTEEAIALILSLPPGIDLSLEGLQALRDEERHKACLEMDAMREEFQKQDEARRKLWGNKHPLHYLDKPPSKPETVNSVKRGKGKKRK